MRTVQLSLDDDLVQALDRLSKQLHMTRSAFAREALRIAVKRHDVTQLEKKHREGYQKHPVVPDEFSVWEAEQAWAYHQK